MQRDVHDFDTFCFELSQQFVIEMKARCRRRYSAGLCCENGLVHFAVDGCVFSIDVRRKWDSANAVKQRLEIFFSLKFNMANSSLMVWCVEDTHGRFRLTIQNQLFVFTNTPAWFDEYPTDISGVTTIVGRR